MSSNNRNIYALVFVLFCAILQPCTGDDSPLYKFVLKDISGKDVSLAKYKGKVNLIRYIFLHFIIFALDFRDERHLHFLVLYLY